MIHRTLMFINFYWNIDELEVVIDWISLNCEELMSLYKMYETGDGSVIELLSNLKKI